jgi:hypothetical protein
MVIWQKETPITVSRISRKGYKLLQKLAILSAIKTHLFSDQCHATAFGSSGRG